jgi:protein-S-isoprenylcysteine O-methyltransferase Ste14
MFSWEKNVPLVTSRFFIYDVIKLSVLTWIAMNLLLFLMFAFLEGIDSYDVNVLMVSGIVIGGFALAILLIAIVFFGNRIPYRFEVDDKKASMTMVSKKAGTANRLAFWLGLLTGRPSVAGSGAIAASREYVDIKWKETYKARYYPAAKIITLMNSWRGVVRLYCTAENFDEIKTYIEKQIAAAEKTRSSQPVEKRPAINMAIVGNLLVVSFAALLFAISPFEPATWLIWASWIAGIIMLLISPLRIFAALATILGFSAMTVLNLLAGLQVRNIFDDFRANPDYRPSYANYSGFDGLDGTEWLIFILAMCFGFIVVITSIRKSFLRKE